MERRTWAWTRSHRLEDQGRRSAESRVADPPFAPAPKAVRREAQRAVLLRLACHPAVVDAAGLDHALRGGTGGWVERGFGGAHRTAALENRTNPGLPGRGSVRPGAGGRSRGIAARCTIRAQMHRSAAPARDRHPNRRRHHVHRRQSWHGVDRQERQARAAAPAAWRRPDVLAVAPDGRAHRCRRGLAQAGAGACQLRRC